MNGCELNYKISFYDHCQRQSQYTMSKKIIRKKIEKKILHKKQPATETNVSAIRCHTWTHSTLKITSGKTKLNEELSHELPTLGNWSLWNGSAGVSSLSKWSVFHSFSVFRLLSLVRHTCLCNWIKTTPRRNLMNIPIINSGFVFEFLTRKQKKNGQICRQISAKLAASWR